MKYSEEVTRAEQKRLEHLIQVVRDMEEKQMATEAMYKERINELESELQELGGSNQRFSRDYDQAKVIHCFDYK